MVAAGQWRIPTDARKLEAIRSNLASTGKSVGGLGKGPCLGPEQEHFRVMAGRVLLLVPGSAPWPAECAVRTALQTSTIKFIRIAWAEISTGLLWRAVRLVSGRDYVKFKYFLLGLV